MKTVLWLVLFLIGLSGVMVPALYFHASSQLPQLETEFDLEKQLRHSVEGERMSMRAGTSEHSRPVQFERPDFSRLPKDLVALYIAQLGCPTFFQTPREDGPRWAWRLVVKVAAGVNLKGDGACERLLAVRLARSLGIESPLQLAVAAQRLHSFLQKDQLIAYDLATVYFDRGVVGVDDASDKLFSKSLDTLDLSQLTELSLALPPHEMYGDVLRCRNESLMRQNRDVLLDDLAAYKLVTQERARSAKAQQLSCHGP